MTERLTKYQEEYQIKHEGLPALVKSYLRVGETLRQPKIRPSVLGYLHQVQELLLKHMLPEELQAMGQFIEWRDKNKRKAFNQDLSPDISRAENEGMIERKSF